MKVGLKVSVLLQRRETLDGDDLLSPPPPPQPSSLWPSERRHAERLISSITTCSHTCSSLSQPAPPTLPHTFHHHTSSCRGPGGELSALPGCQIHQNKGAAEFRGEQPQRLTRFALLVTKTTAADPRVLSGGLPGPWRPPPA